MTEEQIVKVISGVYDNQIKAMWNISAGGALRALKGSLVETISELLIVGVWEGLGQPASRLDVRKKNFIFQNKEGDSYRLSLDKQVWIDGKAVLFIECKAYAEVAMYKRILVDCFLLQKKIPNAKFVLFQLESQLGGDYSSSLSPRGSPSVRALNEYFPSINIDVITLLDGERRIDKAIHKKEFYKKMTEDRLTLAYHRISERLRPYA